MSDSIVQQDSIQIEKPQIVITQAYASMSRKMSWREEVNTGEPNNFYNTQTAEVQLGLTASIEEGADVNQVLHMLWGALRVNTARTLKILRAEKGSRVDENPEEIAILKENMQNGYYGLPEFTTKTTGE